MKHLNSEGIPRKYSYEEADRYNQFVNVDTELEGGDSQNIEVITTNNDRIDVEDEFKSLQYKKVGSPASQQVPLYNVFSPYDLTSLPYLNTKHTTPAITNLEVTPTIPTLLPSLPSLEQLYNLPSSTTPSLPHLKFPVISQEQLNYLQLLKHGFNPLQQLAGSAPLAQNSVSVLTNSRVVTTSVTLTESQEYK